MALGSAYAYLGARQAYARYAAYGDTNSAARVYAGEVVPMRNMAIMSGVAAAALPTSGAALWLTEDVAVSPTLSGVRVGGRW